MIWNKSGRVVLIFFLTLLVALTTLAKNVDDVVVLKNGDRMTGEIKGLQSGELRIKSDYMAEAVRLDWSKIERLESKSTFMIWLVDGKLVTDVMRLLPTNSSEVSNFVIGSSIRVPQLDVIRIAPADRQFWKRLEGSIDFGFSFTSGNDQYQTQLTATTTYRTGDHSFTASVDSAFSGQTEGTSLTRHQFTFDYRKQVSPRWYVGGLFDLLRSDQQSLNLRTTIGGLVGQNIRDFLRSAVLPLRAKIIQRRLAHQGVLMQTRLPALISPLFASTVQILDRVSVCFPV
jgi:hypothetical protein